MGHIINPTVYRLGSIAPWRVTTYTRSKKKRKAQSTEDFLVYNFVTNFFKNKIYKKYLSKFAPTKLRKRVTKYQKKKRKKKRKFVKRAYFSRFFLKFSHLSIARHNNKYKLNLYFYDRFLQKTQLQRKLGQRKLLKRKKRKKRLNKITKRRSKTRIKAVRARLLALTWKKKRKYKKLFLVAKNVVKQKKRIGTQKFKREVSLYRNKINFKKEYPALYYKKYFLQLSKKKDELKSVMVKLEANQNVYLYKENTLYMKKRIEHRLLETELDTTLYKDYVTRQMHLYLKRLRKGNKEAKYKRDKKIKKFIKAKKVYATEIYRATTPDAMLNEVFYKYYLKTSDRIRKVSKYVNHVLTKKLMRYNNYWYYKGYFNDINKAFKLEKYLGRYKTRLFRYRKGCNYRKLAKTYYQNREKNEVLTPEVKKQLKLYALYKYRVGLKLLMEQEKVLRQFTEVKEAGLYNKLKVLKLIMGQYQKNMKGNKELIKFLAGIMQNQIKREHPEYKSSKGRLKYYIKKQMNQFKRAERLDIILSKRKKTKKEDIFKILLKSAYYRRLYHTLVVVSLGTKQKKKLKPNKVYLNKTTAVRVPR